MTNLRRKNTNLLTPIRTAMLGSTPFPRLTICLLIILAIIVATGCGAPDKGSTGPAGPSCPVVDDCTVANHMEWTNQTTGVLPGDGPEELSDLHTITLKEYIDSVFAEVPPEDSNDIKQILETLWPTLPYPHFPYEVITRSREASYDDPDAMAFECPCDPDMAILNYDLLDVEERTQLAEQTPSERESGEGSGNAMMPIPRFAGFQGGPLSYNEVFKNARSYSTPHPDVDRTDATLIAILDTGIDSTLLELLDNEGAIVETKQFISPASITPLEYVIDSNGHGSNVAAIIENYSEGNARYLIYKTHNAEGVGSAFSVICALKCAMDKGADIINMSFGAYHINTALEYELKTIGDKQSPPILVASKGNDGVNTENEYHTPSDNKAVLGVTGLTYEIVPVSSGEPPTSAQPLHWQCSNYSKINEHLIAAPAILTGDGELLGAGTSYSAAMTSGILARLAEPQRKVPYNTTVNGPTWRTDLCNTFEGTEYIFISIE